MMLAAQVGSRQPSKREINSSISVNQIGEIYWYFFAIRDEIHNILSHPIPSMTQIVNDAERISAALHHDIEHHEAPQGRPPSNLIHLMTNIIQQLEEYQPESDVGPALHAARQVAYWSSVFISMINAFPGGDHFIKSHNRFF